MNGYKLSTAADRDLEEIFDYTLHEFGLDQTVQYLSEFETLFNQLVNNPGMGRNRHYIRAGLKSVAKSSHVVFYRVLIDHIRIVRILHGSRDMPTFFE